MASILSSSHSILFGSMSFGFTSSIKNGKRVSSWVRYRDNGQLWSKGEHNKNGNKEGEWVFYNKDGTFDFKMTF